MCIVYICMSAQRVRPPAWPQVPLDAKAYTAEVQRVLVIAQRPCLADRCVRSERMHVWLHAGTHEC